MLCEQCIQTDDIMSESKRLSCGISDSCGGCSFLSLEYKNQLLQKQKFLDGLLGKFGKTAPVEGMDNPLYYRNKVHHAFKRDKSGNIISGPYEKGSHWVLMSEHCFIEDLKCQEIMLSVRELVKSFRIKIYDEDTGSGDLRHVITRRGFSTGETMVVLVAGNERYTPPRRFTEELLKRHPGITTVILNYNSKKTSMILGEREKILYGPGYIYDLLLGNRFRISSKSFYQVNPVQTEVLYKTAMEFAQLSGSETVLDAYCGIGTIGISAAGRAKKVIGVELNKDAVRDAIINAKENGIENAEFYPGDAGKFLRGRSGGEHFDVIFMDPPRNGSSKEFLDSVIRTKPDRLVYISCGPESLARDLKYLTGNGFLVQKIQPVDMFPYTEHVETVVLLSGKIRKNG